MAFNPSNFNPNKRDELVYLYKALGIKDLEIAIGVRLSDEDEMERFEALEAKVDALRAEFSQFAQNTNDTLAVQGKRTANSDGSEPSASTSSDNGDEAVAYGAYDGTSKTPEPEVQ